MWILETGPEIASSRAAACETRRELQEHLDRHGVPRDAWGQHEAARRRHLLGPDDAYPTWYWAEVDGRTYRWKEVLEFHQAEVGDEILSMPGTNGGPLIMGTVVEATPEAVVIETWSRTRHPITPYRWARRETMRIGHPAPDAA
ncbi:preprotein translocase subunit YajC [Actinomadura sp. K4S16]|uniref:preprotein translocase subunit YajC n=1 Tax=Actinomadura sp. K4S16 TaxID=1316147 RepID=UPI0011EFDA0E|nr:preprotein translocase subunit YajC [Actinomadura sp. K4S16]